MKRPPNSKSNLERAISRYADNDAVRANELAVSLSNAIVAQMIGAGVVKGGTSLRLRYGEEVTRVTKDLDTAFSVDLDSFLKDVGGKLKMGWSGFTGEIVVLKQASPKGIPFDYVMQPWPARVVRNENWDVAYLERKGGLKVLPTVDEAIIWANDLVARIDAEK